MELFNAFIVSLQSVWTGSGFSAFTMGHAIMIAVGLVLLYMAFVKEFEPLLLGPIAFGCILANFPGTGFLEEPGLMQAIHYGIANEIFPPLIFLGIGAMTDFGPLLARPVVLLLGAAALGNAAAGRSCGCEVQDCDSPILVLSMEQHCCFKGLMLRDTDRPCLVRLSRYLGVHLCRVELCRLSRFLSLLR
jgi:hypothetical protein